MSDELAAELAFDRLAAQLADEAAPPPTRMRAVIRRAESFPALASRVRAEVQGQAPSWLERFSGVRAARRAAPSRAAYRSLRHALETAAVEALGAPWSELTSWCAGVPHAEQRSGQVRGEREAATAPAGGSNRDPSKDLSKDPLKDTSKDEPESSSKRFSMHASKDFSMHASKDFSMHASKDFSMHASSASGDDRSNEVEDWLELLWPAHARSLLTVEHRPRRPRTWRRAGAIHLEVRAAPSTTQGAFELAHELGHAAAALVHPAPLPRAVDEAVAAFVALQLERGGVAEREQHRALRAHRVALALGLAQVEAELERLEELVPGASLPWALWHDAGAQSAYLHAEVLASQWWDQGLRWRPPWPAAQAALAAAITAAVAVARALPAPWR